MEKDRLVIKARGEDGFRNLSIRIRETLINRLDQIAAQTNRSRNEVICTLLEYALDHTVVEGVTTEEQ